MSNITWGLQRDITPRLGARLVQEGIVLTMNGKLSPQDTLLVVTIV